MNLHSEPLRDDDIPEACELFAKVFGHSTQAEHWRWKYQHGPRLAGLNRVIRSPQGQLIGHVGASVFSGHIQGRWIPMAQVTDVMVDPAARSSFASPGVYAQFMHDMLNILHEQFPDVFAYGFVGIRPYRLGSRMGHYKSQQECRAGLMPAGQSTGWRDWIYSAQLVDWSEAARTQLFDRIWQRAAPSMRRPTVVRNNAYMQWRYAQHPQNSYQLWRIEKMGITSGWVVTRDMPSGQHAVIDMLPVQAGDLANQETLAAMAATGRALQTLQPNVPVVLSAWNIETAESRLQEPIIAVEIRTGDWHTLTHRPVFVPGDTDVF